MERATDFSGCLASFPSSIYVSFNTVLKMSEKTLPHKSIPYLSHSRSHQIHLLLHHHFLLTLSDRDMTAPTDRTLNRFVVTHLFGVFCPPSRGCGY